MTLGDAEEDGDWRSLGGRGRAGGREEGTNTGLWPPSTHLLQLWWDLWVGATPPCGCERGRILCPGHPYVSRAQPGAYLQASSFFSFLGVKKSGGPQ